MHIIHNLDSDGTSIIEQLPNFAVAVNIANPKAEDFSYKYSDLTQEHKDIIWGMALAIESLDSFEDNREADYQNGASETLNTMINELENDVIVRCYEWMINDMCKALISFADDEIA